MTMTNFRPLRYGKRYVCRARSAVCTSIYVHTPVYTSTAAVFSLRKVCKPTSPSVVVFLDVTPRPAWLDYRLETARL